MFSRVSQYEGNAYPYHEKQFFVEYDTSNYAIGGVLSQKGDDGTLHPYILLLKDIQQGLSELFYNRERTTSH